jgi:hypothetical protein
MPGCRVHHAADLSSVINLTALPAALSVGRNAHAQMQVTIAVKATFTWGKRGDPIAAEPLPLVEQDLFVGDPATSGIAAPGEVGSPKPMVDVVLKGAVVFRTPIVEIDVSLALGDRLRKVVRVFGDRVWLPTASGVAPSRARPVDRVPILWERSFGGTDPTNPGLFEPRNPVGSGMARSPRTLDGRPAPSFEDPRLRIASFKDRPAPCGFGAIAPHWQPRVRLAGTYDDAWQKQRCPLLPVDFNPGYFNVAPADQQMAAYVVGEEVRLDGMTVAGQDVFTLPAVRVPIAFRSRSDFFETYTLPDTVVIEPAERRFSVVARATYTPLPNMLALHQVLVGPISRGRRRALETGKLYVDLRGAKGS